MKILIVDDENLARHSLRMQLERLGYEELYEAESGSEAIQVLQKEQPTVAFIDIQMPGMSGLETMEQARKLGCRTIFVILSSYNLFEYAQKAIEYSVHKYMLKPISDENISNVMQEVEERLQSAKRERKKYEEANTLLKRNEEVLRRKYVYELINATGEKQKRVLQILEAHGIVYTKPLFQVVLLRVRPERARDEEWMKFAVLNIAEEIWRPFQVRVDSFDEEQGVGLLLNVEKGIGEQEFRNCIKTLHEELRKFSKLIGAGAVTIGVGEIMTGMEQLERTYESASQTLNQFLVKGEDRIYYTEEVKSKNNGKHSGKEYWETRFKKALLSEDEGEVEECIDELYEICLKDEVTDIRELHKLHLDFFMIMRKAVENCEMVDMEGIEDEFWLYKKIQKLETIEEMKAFLMEKVRLCIKIVQDGGQSGKKRAVRNGKKFIEENLGHELTLDAVAEHVNLSAVYFSKIFKEEVGKNFIDYVTEQRMNRACEMLRRNEKISDICEQIGYLDIKHFYKVFKKYMGISTGQYRKKFSL